MEYGGILTDVENLKILKQLHEEKEAKAKEKSKGKGAGAGAGRGAAAASASGAKVGTMDSFVQRRPRSAEQRGPQHLQEEDPDDPELGHEDQPGSQSPIPGGNSTAGSGVGSATEPVSPAAPVDLSGSHHATAGPYQSS